MKIKLGIIAIALTLMGGGAWAQDEGGAVSDSGGGGGGGSAFGIGAQAMLTGPVGASITYDVGMLHFDGIFYFETLGEDNFGAGGRIWYSLHQGSQSDFSLGGGAGINFNDDEDDDIHIEGGAKVRIFLVPNVALSAMVGVAVIIDSGEGDGIVASGQTEDAAFRGAGVNGGFGFTYYFK
jgi:hypothetical protein